MADYVFLCLMSGALGGALFHIYWMISLATGNKGKAIQSNARDSRFRAKAFLLNIFSGAIAGFIVWCWFFDQVIPNNKLAVIAFIAGLAGEGFLGFIQKLAGVKAA